MIDRIHEFSAGGLADPRESQIARNLQILVTTVILSSLICGCGKMPIEGDDDVSPAPAAASAPFAGHQSKGELPASEAAINDSKQQHEEDDEENPAMLRFVFQHPPSSGTEFQATQSGQIDLQKFTVRKMPETQFGEMLMERSSVPYGERLLASKLCDQT
jgi:hypothetical protein